MKCPNCKVEMDEGYIAQSGLVWAKKSGLFNKLNRMTWGTKITAWKCPKCRKIELQVEGK